MKILESKRLILRSWNLEDLNDLYEFMSNYKVAKLAGFNVRKNKKEALAVLNKFIADSYDSLWAIELKGCNKAIGWIELHDCSEKIYKDSQEIGFVLSEEYWGKGLMKEAIALVAEYGFNEKNIKTIVCSHFKENIQSKRVIEKSGFNYVLEDKNKVYYYVKRKIK